MTVTVNAAPHFNKEISDMSSHIKDYDIAMKIIHALPPTLFTLQTLLLGGAPPSDKSNWDLQAFQQCITITELHAHSATLRLATKLVNLIKPKALMAHGDPHK